VNEKKTIELIADRTDRLDRYLTSNILGNEPISRAQITKWIRDGAVSVNGTITSKSAFQVSEGDAIKIILPMPKLATHSAFISSEMLNKVSIIYHDDDLVIIDKSAGLVVHHGSGTSNLVTLVDLLEPMGFKTSAGESGRPGIVHRLDKETSGIMVVARTAFAHAKLSADFAERRVNKEYCAIVHETPRRRTIFGSEDTGVIDQPITRDTMGRTKMMIGEGRGAVTEWQIGERFSHGISLRLFPKTGRTHQIRVHCAFVGAPLFGDKIYSDRGTRQPDVVKIETRLGRHALHARTLTFQHPRSQTLVTFECPLPSDMVECITALKALS